MAGFDTNVLARWLLDDDAEQSERVGALIAKSQAANQPFFIPNSVVLELEWVLRSRYGFDKLTLLKTMGALLETAELVFESEAVLEQALDFFRHSPADFADCLHAGACAAAGHLPMLSFDRNAAKVPGVKLLDRVCH